MVGKVATVKACQKVKKQQKKKQLGPIKKETKKVTKIKGKCFLCGEKGHWKRNFLKSQNKKEEGNMNYLETCFLADSTDSWIIDSGATKVCKLQKSIYGLKQASRYWNIRFDHAVKGFGFIHNPNEPCVYKRIKGDKLVFLILYVDDILLIGNDVGVLTSVKEWLAKQFDMKDLGEASFILGIQVIRDRKNRTIALSQASYIDKILSRFSMHDSKKGMLPFRHGIKLSKEQVPKNEHEEQFMSRVPYA
ncbi:hypothetical protein LWI28_028107 [Acer negundo]|uniref:Reverse transcriptase Ty1/copia-type domain-containing protein n=1 Tax=Acer negundo TaxID=4023 RepID=A0AAD5NKW8_ACENE|nr:hypothetical protein LWI28_028107 [Acer negundo]